MTSGGRKRTRAMTRANAVRLAAILKEQDIELEVGGCGCCGSPWAKVTVDGEVFHDADNFDFDSRDPSEW